MRFSFAALVLLVATAGAQAPKPASSTIQHLVVRGLDGHDHTVTGAELARMARHDTTVSSHRVQGHYSGVSVADVLALVHAPAGDSLRGKALATYIVFVGSDGYRVTFSPADFDPLFTDRTAILADEKDGKPLPPDEAPFHLIVSGEKRPARWVHSVVRIEVRRVP